jgi:CubicO group peptidase (beta-lactamase class C family)
MSRSNSLTKPWKIHAALLALLSVSTLVAGPRISAGQAVAETDKATVADTEAYLRRLEKLGFAGVVLVARNGAPMIAEGYGLADRERGLGWTPATVSDIGSITKQFTGAAILKLEEEGRLRVGDPIGRYFKDIPADKAGITLHQLLSHSSGLSDPDDVGDYDPVPLDEYVRKVLARPLLFPPGGGYEYANANFSLLGAIVEQLSGMSYEAFLRERLFFPAGMYETGYILPRWGDGRVAQGYRRGERWGTILERPMAADGPHWALRANGGIHSTAFDMLRWVRALMEGKALSPESMKKYWTPHVSEGGDSFYGYGWSIVTLPGETKVVTHNGGNGIYFADLALVPKTGLVVFLMTNIVADMPAANDLLQQLGRRFLTGEPYPPIPELVDVDDALLKSLAGTYRLQGSMGSVRIEIEGKKLLAEAVGRKAFSVLHSVREAEPGRLDRLDQITDKFVAGNRAGDFRLLFKAYAGKVPMERLKESWGEVTKDIESAQGRILRYEILGSARTRERDETVVRFTCERGFLDRTYVWSLKEEGRLLGASGRGLAVRLRLFPSGGGSFFTWDGGARPPKPVRFETGADGRMNLKIGESKDLAVR